MIISVSSLVIFV